LRHHLRRTVAAAALLTGVVVGSTAVPSAAQTEGAGNFDQFGTAPSIAPSLPGAYEYSNVGASKQPGEPNHANNPGGKSVWVNWTAPRAGTVVINTIGSDFDTLLAVYRGRTVQSLTLVKQNDDRRPGQLQSRVQFHAVAGQRYRIAVDGYNPPNPPPGTPAEEGAVVLNLRWL
jgi:hypothetical protein